MTNLNRHRRKSKREEKRLKEKRETGNLALRLDMPANAGKTQKITIVLASSLAKEIEDLVCTSRIYSNRES